VAKKEFPREGAWAVDDRSRVGLLYRTERKDGAREEFHIVGESGETRLIQVRPWQPSAALLASQGAVLRSRREDGTRVEEFVTADLLGPEDADLPIENYPWSALVIAPVASIPANRIAHTDAETLASMGYF